MSVLRNSSVSPRINAHTDQSINYGIELSPSPVLYVQNWQYNFMHWALL